MAKSQGKTAKTAKRLTTEKRRMLVNDAIRNAGLVRPNQIRRYIKEQTGKTCEHRTIKADLAHITKTNHDIFDDYASGGSTNIVMNMIQDMAREVAQLRDAVKEFKQTPSIDQELLQKALAGLKRKPEFVNISRQIEQACSQAQREKNLKTYAYALKILDEKRDYYQASLAAYPMFRAVMQKLGKRQDDYLFTSHETNAGR